MFDLFSEQFEEDVRRSLVSFVASSVKWFKLIEGVVINNYPLQGRHLRGGKKAVTPVYKHHNNTYNNTS